MTLFIANSDSIHSNSSHYYIPNSIYYLYQLYITIKIIIVINVNVVFINED
jgi:hypothetical protein